MVKKKNSVILLVVALVVGALIGNFAFGGNPFDSVLSSETGHVALQKWSKTAADQTPEDCKENIEALLDTQFFEAIDCEFIKSSSLDSNICACGVGIK